MKDFAMFSDTGNAAVFGIVLSAKRSKLEWDAVMDILRNLSKVPGFEESTDTAVRESVWMELESMYDSMEY